MLHDQREAKRIERRHRANIEVELVVRVAALQVLRPVERRAGRIAGDGSRAAAYEPRRRADHEVAADRLPDRQAEFLQHNRARNDGRTTLILSVESVRRCSPKRLDLTDLQSVIAQSER